MIRSALQGITQRWPVARQLAGEPYNEVATSEQTHAMRSRLQDARAVTSICPYCAVGCGTLIHLRGDEIVSIEGDPASPINRGTLCPKGADTMQLAVNPNRLTRTLYRRPHGTEWEVVDLEWAMDRITQRFIESRKRTWVEEKDGQPVRHTAGIALMGGAVLDNEENYLTKKLAVGTGVVYVENQARLCHASTVPGLGTPLGRGGATTFQMDLANSDCILIMGSNLAEAHPVTYRYVMRAREKGAAIIHVDPRFTRTSATSTIHASIRAGSDLAFLGGLIHYALESERWNTDPFFREYLLHYTNAAEIITSEFRDAEELGGFFSGWQAEKGSYDPSSWQPRRIDVNGSSREAPYDNAELESLRPRGLPERDETLTAPFCVFQLLKRHFAPYTPERVAEVTGVPRDRFVEIAQALLDNSGRDRTSSIAYAMAWTQRSTGSQIIATASILQLVLGNIGRPGGGIAAMRGHATIQGSTDIPTLFDLLPGYLHMPSNSPGDATLDDHVLQEEKGGEWDNARGFTVSLLKAYFGDAATPENEFGYQLLPRITGNHSHMPMFVEMHAGRMEGLILMGQNPAVGGQNAGFQREALAKLKWLVVRDQFPVESATFWKHSPEVKSGQLKTEEIETEVFFLPSSAITEKNGSFTNTQRLLQWHHKALDPPGDARSDAWFTFHLGRRLKEHYANSTERRDLPIQALTWDYPVEGKHQEPVTEEVLKEVNGYTWSVDPAARRQLQGIHEIKDDGTTACGCWIYCGVHPGENLAAKRENSDDYVAHGWGWSWPGNIRLLYNRCSADPQGRPWSERKKYIWWDEDAGRWTGLGDHPDFPLYKSPDTPGTPNSRGLERHSGSSPFVLKPEGRAWLFFPAQMKDGPMPTHYEPWESPVHNLFYPIQERNPMTLTWNVPGNPYHGIANPEFPYVLTTYRLTEHHGGGVFTRWNSHLAELQPTAFVEVSPELAAEKGIVNGGWATVMTERAEIEARVLVTGRMVPLKIAGRVIHQVGFPWHFGYEGIATGGSANDLVALVGEPNTSIHEAKALTCNIRPGRIDGARQ